MQEYFIVTGRHLEPLPPKPVLSDFYMPSEDHHSRELVFITLSMIGIAFTGSNYLFSSLSKESIDKERKRHNKAIADLQRAQIEWAKKTQERLDYINNQIIKECKAEKRFTDLNSAMQEYFIVTGRHLEPLPPKPVLSDFSCRLKITTVENLFLLHY